MKKLKQKLKNFKESLQTTHLWGTTLDNILLKLLYTLALILTIIWLLPTQRPFEYSNLTVGSIAGEEIIAPFTFPIIKTKAELEEERRKAWLSVPPVYDKNLDIVNKEKILLNSFFRTIEEFFKSLEAEGGNGQNAQKAEERRAKVDSLLKLIYLNYNNLSLTEENLVQLHDIYKSGNLSRFKNALNQGLMEVYSQGILDRPKNEIPEKEITIVQNGIESKKKIDEVFDASEASSHIYTLLQKEYPEGSPEIESANYLLAVFLYPNLFLNEKMTLERKNNAVHDIAQTRGFVYENQRIIDSHEIVTEDVYRKLQSLAYALNKRAASPGKWKQTKFYLGKLLFALSAIFLLLIFIYFFQQKLYQNNLHLSMITLLLLLQFFSAGLIVKFLNWSPYIIPFILAPMLIAMLLNARIAFVATVLIGLVLGAMQANDYSFTFLILVVGSVALYSVQKIRNRAQMFRAIFYVALAYVIVTLTLGLLHFEMLKDIFSVDLIYMILSGVLTSAVVFLFIGIFERIFDITTDLTLLELSDLNHPLLKRLSVEAPGTFHHTIIVGNLAETACKEIGANALLARVGCYYHDIGKMLKPEYFVENQMDAMNKHENLSPHMSSLILVNHVKKGIELAEKYKLPKRVRQFIPEHHGTSLMTYFYNKAKESAGENEINKEDFRYPGPKPQTKETAIAMLADTVEAASRTLQNPTPQRIRNFVDTLINKKMEEGQLTESNLTLKEIEQIKAAFLPILMGIHHLRIEYPSEPAKEKKTRPEQAEGALPTNGKKQKAQQQEKENRILEEKNKNKNASGNPDRQQSLPEKD